MHTAVTLGAIYKQNYNVCGAGLLEADYIDSLFDVNETAYFEAAKAAGYGASSTEAMIKDARRTKKDLAFFVELHIEQVCGG